MTMWRYDFNDERVEGDFKVTCCNYVVVRIYKKCDMAYCDACTEKMKKKGASHE